MSRVQCWRAAGAILIAFASAGAFAPAPAAAHPLGNFSINHLVEVRISTNRIDLHYILDQAEIPTFQERGLSIPAGPRTEARRGAQAPHPDGRRRGHAAELPPAGEPITHPPGQGGLPLTRVELWLRAAVSEPHRVRISDQTFPGRVGWKAVVIRSGAGTDVRSSVALDGPDRRPAQLPPGPALQPARPTDGQLQP